MHPNPTYLPFLHINTCPWLINFTNSHCENYSVKTTWYVTQYTLLSTLFSCIHFNVPLVWFEASGFCPTIIPGSSQGLLSDNPAVALGHGASAALDLWDPPLQTPQQFIDRVDVGVDQLRALGLGGS